MSIIKHVVLILYPNCQQFAPTFVYKHQIGVIWAYTWF